MAGGEHVKPSNEAEKLCFNLLEVFIKYVIAVDSDDGGLFGPASGYYCTVEQQGRLALHLHGLIFNKKTLSPQQIKTRILDKNSPFQQSLLAHLDSIRKGEFFSGTKDDVKAKIQLAESEPSYISPERTLPKTPPPHICTCSKKWLNSYYDEIDDLLFKSNLHDCFRSLYPDGTIKNHDLFETSCLNNKFKKCKARFPRECYPVSTVDSDTGHIYLKKLEPWINDVCPPLTYLIRGNTDVTSILSDYITKTGLKTHTIFEKSTEIIEGNLSDKEKSRRIITRVINLLSTKLELGSPMISLYLLQNPDHYTSHEFVPFYWKSFVSKARSYWQPDSSEDQPKVVLVKRKGKLIGLPLAHDSYTLYDWVSEYTRIRKPNSKTRQKIYDNEDDSQEDSEDDATHKYDFKYLQFLKDHPLHDTHVPVHHSKNRHLVPNFLGGILPRPDKEDREYYCCTMLVLFCPWRSGKDLKQADQSWHEAFESYDFPSHCKSYIQNINLRYEALDARDDFRAQMNDNLPSIGLTLYSQSVQIF
ncbi:hypothetical protein F5880DRAFT_1625438 [Lentinula raphanica]|nr:hypothetical protein F5880DRAFT_1625438 [Lentinula raphanica]